MEFYQTKIGRTFFEHQIPQLIDALNGLAAALSSPAQAVHLPVSSDPHFLRFCFPLIGRGRGRTNWTVLT